MGVYRFLLAASVVYFHFGGGSWVVGRIAVAAFYVVSGFVIFRVLDRNYGLESQGIVRFYLNRILRLGPLFLVISGLTYAWLVVRGSNEIPFEGSTIAYFRNVPVERSFLDAVWSDVTPRILDVDGVHILTFSPDLIPPGWSIGIEMCFYIIAPLGLWLFHINWRAGLALLSLAIGYFVYAILQNASFDFFENDIYKNFYTTAFLFLYGGTVYQVSRRVEWRLPYRWTIAVLVVFVWWLVFWTVPNIERLREPNLPLLFVGYAVVVVVSTLVALSEAPSGRATHLDRRLGDLSYGMYINHFLLGATMVWANLKIQQSLDTGDNPLFGRPNTREFGAAAIILSAGFAALTFVVIERPIQSVRRRVRHGPVDARDRAPAPRPDRARPGAEHGTAR